MSEENLLHIKLERGEFLESRRDVLASQIALLKILTKVKSYRSLRDEELQLKLKFYRKIKELRMGIGSLQKTLPKVKEEEKTKENMEKESSTRKTTPHDLSVEQQLQEIQRKLDQLQSRNV